MKVTLRTSVSFLAVAAIAGGLFAATPAAAQDAASIAAIQKQIQALQAQLKQLQVDAQKRDAALKQAQDEAAQARMEAQQAQQQAAKMPATPAATGFTLPPGALIVTQPANDKDASGQPIQNPNKPNGKFNLGGVTVTLGGYVDMTGYYRSRNMNAGTSTPFKSLPFNGPTPQGDANEFNMTAQNTRLSLRADGKVGSESAVSGYVEADFNNGAGGANSTQSYSYTPRLRQAFAEYTDTGWDAYALAGQAWSLATPFKKGLDPFQTWQPLTLDTGYLPGYDYLRVPLVRVVKGFDLGSVAQATFGLEADAPQTVFGGTAPTITNGNLYTTYAGAGGLNPQTNYSVNGIPDVIGKAAIDTAFGHYEVFGVVRQFESQVSVSLNGSKNTVGDSNTFHANGGGVGGAAFIPVTKYADIVGSFVTGSGIGRYGAAGMPDVTYAANGSLKPLNETMGLAGVIGHVLPTLDVYGYVGIDQIGSSYFGSKGGGYGNPTANNAGCFNPNAGGSGCAGNNYQLSDFTVGYNWTFMQGGWGKLATGLTYEYAKREAFNGKGGAPTAINNMVFVNVRYTPF